MNQKQLDEILRMHNLWLTNASGGVRANFRNANLGNANLSYANFSCVDLSYIDLSDANLCSAIGDMNFVKSMQCEKYRIVYTATILQIGCEKHTIEEWEKFTDDEISKMDDGALEWWTKWKPIIMQIIEMSPAKETK